MADEDCPKCGGSGECPHCGGDGIDRNGIFGIGIIPDTCHRCSGTGKCPKCEMIT